MFVDTNVLVQSIARGAPDRSRAQAALALHAASGESLCISRQILREFLAAATRPQPWAAPMPLAAAVATAQSLDARFELLEDSPLVWDLLVDLSRTFSFGGRQVHDANIVATMLAHGENRLLTFNERDFRRFASVIEIVVP